MRFGFFASPFILRSELSLTSLLYIVLKLVSVRSKNETSTCPDPTQCAPAVSSSLEGCGVAAVELDEVVVAKCLVFQPGPSELSNGPHRWSSIIAKSVGWEMRGKGQAHKRQRRRLVTSSLVLLHVGQTRAFTLIDHGHGWDVVPSRGRGNAGG
jgi:hypothetical protein